MTRSSKGLVATLAINAFAFAFAAFAPAVAPAAGTGCDLVAAPSGSDSNVGTVADPFETPTRLVGALAPGQAGCLRAGSYVLPSALRVTTPATALRSYPGESATLQGVVRVEATARGAVIEQLVLDGRNSSNALSPLIYASEAVLRGNEITNFNTDICVTVDQYPGAAVPVGVLIEGNRIHNCGRLPATNQDHGVYISRAVGTVIRGNWIYDNADRGIQLYSQAHQTLVTGNIIDGNGQGVLFGGLEQNPSSNNVVENNVISNSVLRDNVESSWGGAPGTGNVVRNNCIGGGAHDEGDGGILGGAQRGFSTLANQTGRPQFVNRPADNLTVVPGSPCGGAVEGHPGGARSDQITLHVKRAAVAVGENLVLTGSAAGAPNVQLRIQRGGAWRVLKTAAAAGDGDFKVKLRFRKKGRVRIKATADAAQESHPVRVKVSAAQG